MSPGIPNGRAVTGSGTGADLGGGRTGPRDLEVSWRLSRHGRRLFTLALAGLFIAIITRRPEFAGVAAPALLLLAVGRARRPVRVGVRARPSAARAYEDEPAGVEVSAEGQGDEHSVRWTLHPGRAVEPAGGTSADGDTARFAFVMDRWGRRKIGTVDGVLRDRWRIAEGRFSLSLPSLDCYPRPAEQRTRVVLSRLPNRLGEHSARVAGEGIEFAGVREYVPGDRQRQINWPASTRLGRLQVNTFAAERSQDVVLLVDATSDVGEPGSSALDLGLRGASGAAKAYLDARDRVGVITYQWGGARWLAPGLGRRQVYRIVDSLLSSDAGWSRGANFSRLPRAALPPGALVVVFSPLLDQRFVETLRDMRERGFTLLVIDVLNAEPPARRSRTDRMARRIWRMEQEAIRFSLREIGVPVVHWDGEQPLDLPLAPYTRRTMVVRR